MEIVKGEGTEATKRRLFARKTMWDQHQWLHDVITGDAPDGVSQDDLAAASAPQGVTLDARERETAGL